MRKIILSFFILFIIDSVNAQQGWNIINSSLFNSDVNKLFFINDEIGFAKTGNEIMKTVDGAVTWSKINLNFNVKLLDFCFTNSSTGFIVGDSGIILKTIDGGKNWFKLNSGNTFYLNRIRILDTNNVYILGIDLNIPVHYIILKTINGGHSWETQYYNTNPIFTIDFPSINTGFAFGDSINYTDSIYFYKTNDSGKTWIKQSRLSTDLIFDCSFPDTNTIYIVGMDGSILKSIDGGRIWSRKYSGSSKYLYSVCFLDSKIGFICGEGGEIIKTKDGGETWEYLSIGNNFNMTLSKIFFTDTITGYIIGSNKTILKTNDGGHSWKVLNSDVVLNSVSFPDSNTGYSVGNNGFILKTIDRGITWSTQNLCSSCFITNTIFTDYLSGNIILLDWWQDYSSIITTSNGGITWYKTYSTFLFGVVSLFFTDKQTGYAVGDSGTIVKTTDAGYSWSKLNSGSNSLLQYVYFPNIDTGYVMGSRDSILVILKTTNAGLTWSTLYTANSGNIQSVFFPDANTGYVLESGYNILKTIDGGITWTKHSIGSSKFLNSLFFSNKNTGYAVGDSGTILKTIDGGDNWTIQNACTKSCLYSVNFTDANTGYIVGEHSTILKTTNGGLNYIISTYKTSNLKVYPNPVSDKLYIEIPLFFKESVISISNINGQEIIRQPLNSNKIEFDISEFPKGIYILKYAYKTSIETFKIFKQ